MSASFVSHDAIGVTVLLPTIRYDEWLDSAVHSILTQNVEPLQLILILDGVAPDETRQWADDPRITTLHVPSRGGLGAALRHGLQSADHPFVARLDADDIALPGRLRHQRQLLASDPQAVMVASPALLIDENERIIGKIGVGAPGDVRYRLLTRNPFIHSSVMFRRDAVLAVDSYRADLQQFEDYELWLRLALKGKLILDSLPVVMYRIHSNQMTRRSKRSHRYLLPVVARRRELARSLGRRPSGQSVQDFTWLVAQYSRTMKLRKPKYMKRQLRA